MSTIEIEIPVPVPATSETDPIIQCIFDDNLAELKKQLRSKDIQGLYPCLPWGNFITPLLAAVRNGNERICTFLLKNGADANQPSHNVWTPLHYASFSSVAIAKKLIDAGANPNGLSSSIPQRWTPVQYAAENDRDDIVRELVLAGANLDTNYGMHTSTDNKLHRILHHLASQSELIFKIKTFFDFKIASMCLKPEEIFDQFRQNMLLEHPLWHVTLLEFCFNTGGQEGYQWLCTRMLKETQKLDIYVQEAVSRLSRMPPIFQGMSLHTSYAVSCIMKDVTLEVSLHAIPQILYCLKSSNLPKIHDLLLLLLRMIIQKTSEKHAGWTNSFLEGICKGVVPFTHPRHSSLLGIIAFSILADLYAFEHVPDLISKLGVTSVPEKILEAVEMQTSNELKEKLQQLNSAIIRQHDPTLMEQSLHEELAKCKVKKKKKKKRKKKKAGQGVQPKEGEHDVSDPVMETTSVESTDGKMGLPVEEVGDPKPVSSGIEESFINLSKSCHPWFEISVSDRWRPQLQELAKTDPSQITKVGNLNLVTKKDFLIAKGNDGTEVYVGLKDDGTEVAIKRMLKSNYEALKNECLLLRLPELESPRIVRYVDFAEDENFGYLVLQLCEYTLEEYIKDHLPQDNKERQGKLKEIMCEIFESLEVLHNQETKVLHRDIKPQNVLIDVTGKARLADFGISRRLSREETTLHTSNVGTKCWMAWEAIDKSGHGFKRCSDIQVAGMLMYYTLSGGHHPFGDDIWCEINIVCGKYTLDQVEDEVAKDLIEWMITREPKDRPTIEQVLHHPYFWTDEKRLDYLKKMGNEKEIVHRDKTDKDIVEALDRHAAGRSVIKWRSKLDRELVEKMDKRGKAYPENPMGLLRLIRNLHEHYPEDAASVDLLGVFPDLFISMFKFNKEKEWNSRTTLKKFFED